MESKLYKGLEKYVLSKIDYEEEDTGQDPACYSCGEAYSLTGDAGPCIMHPDFYIVKVPSRHMGLVMGQGGQTIDKIQRESGAKLPDVQKFSSRQDTVVQIQGGPSEVGRAESMIQKILQFKSRRGSGGAASFPGPRLWGV